MPMKVAAVRTLGFIDRSVQKQPDVLGETRRRMSVLAEGFISGVDGSAIHGKGFGDGLKLLLEYM
jgi:hypothetical protein